MRDHALGILLVIACVSGWVAALEKPTKKHSIIFTSPEGNVLIEGYSSEESCIQTVNEIRSVKGLNAFCVGID
jgi:hypothetical protein